MFIIGNQPVLNNEGKVSCSMNQRKPLCVARTQDWTISSQARYPLGQCFRNV